MIQLKNEHLIARIHPKGAELQELSNPSNGINYMWSGDPAWWGKFSPVLFPIVGTLKENIYYYNGNKYSLPRHGFARDRTFIAEQLSEISALFSLNDDMQTREVYPFHFCLKLHYLLDGDQLICRYIVVNTGREPLWFSVGAHPAFAVPQQGVSVESSYENHQLIFNRSSKLERWKLADGLIADQNEMIPLDNGKLQLSESLFKDDAIVLKHIPDTEIRLVNNQQPHGISFRFEGFPYFGIWAPAGAPFVCLEPWCGIADNIQHDQELTHKEGIQQLHAGEEFIRQWSVKCF
jgi:galactose mutarotase-like enzyme